MATLVIYRGDSVVERVELGHRDLKIGRGPENEISLPDPGKAVSRFHAELRYERDQYVLLDLNSQNGIWIDGRRVQREPLKNGVAATIGPYRIVLEGATGAAAERQPPLAPGAAAAGGGASNTIVAAGAAARPAAPRPARAKRPPPAGPVTSPAPGLIGWLLRLPRPVLFGGFAVICLLIIIAGQIVNRKPATVRSSAPAVAPAQASATPPEPALSNAERIARHLAAGKLALEQNRPAEAKEQFELALLVDREHAEALELKARAEEALRAAQPAAGLQSAPPSGETAAQVAPGSGQGAPVVQTGVAPSDRPVPAGSSGGRRAEPERAGRDRSSRERDLQSRYAAARELLERGDYEGAQRALTALVVEAPEYLDAPALLEKAREAEREANRAAAAAAVAEGNRLIDAGDPRAALDAYERGQKLDAANEGAAAGILRARQRMRELGEDAFKRARQYDAVGRMPEALALYERAVQLLPEDHPNRAAARDRAAALKGIVR